MKHATQRTRTIEIARSSGIISAKQALENGIHSQVLTRLVEEGLLEWISRGYYRWKGSDVTEYHALVLVSAAVSRGVICLPSSLQYHGVGTQIPSEVWLAIPNRMRKPALKYPLLRVVRYSDPALSTGVEFHTIEKQKIAVFNLNKTIADCFKYRNKIGMDVVLEALTEAWRERRLDLSALNRYAVVCRVQKVIQPYLETLVQ